MDDVDDIVEDLALINDISDEDYTKLLSIYSETDCPPLDRALSLKRLTLSSGHSSNTRKAFVKLLGFLTETVVAGRNFDDSFKELDEAVSKIASEDERAKKGWTRIKSAVPLLEKYFIEKKVEDLKDRYSRIEMFQITTDVRPIFDLKKEKIQRNIYPCILKLNTVDDKEMVCEFYDDDIDDLLSELKRAKLKIARLKERYE